MIITLLIIIILILINALYVAAEFSTVSTRRARLVQLVENGNTFARLLLPITEDRRKLDNYIAACQLGITTSSLLLGYFGQARLTPVLNRYLGGIPFLSEALAISLSATGVLISLTTLQVILGELVPKSVGIQYPEKLALLTTLPTQWSVALFKPLIWVFNGSGHLVLNLLGIKVEDTPKHIHAPREIMMLINESKAGGVLDEEERRLLQNSLQLRDLAVRQVMIPRNRMLAAPIDRPISELLTLLANSPYSRLPIYEDTVDNVIGMVHLKDLLCLHHAHTNQGVSDILRPVLYVPETMAVDRVFAKLQRQRYHIAIILDEFGGTAGFVTLEDLIEELFGELQDEFDPVVPPSIQIMPQNRVLLRGDVLIEDLNEALGTHLPTESADTIGGLILNTLGRVPDIGEKVTLEDLTFVVDKMDGKRISTLSLKITKEQEEMLASWIQ